MSVVAVSWHISSEDSSGCFVKNELFRLKFSMLITHPIWFFIFLWSLRQNISASSGKKVKEKCYFSVLPNHSMVFCLFFFFPLLFVFLFLNCSGSLFWCRKLMFAFVLVMHLFLLSENLLTSYKTLGNLLFNTCQ